MTRAGHALAGASLLNAGLGTFYAWSVFVAPFEASLDASRAEVSGVFSVATACFVALMLLGPTLYGRIPMRWLAALASLMAAAGLALAAWAMWLPLVVLGYGVLFGAANGLGYGLALHVVSVRFERRRGLATGVVVMAYALGAAVAAPLLSGVIPRLGLDVTLAVLALVFVVLAAAMVPLLGAARVEAAGRRERATARDWARATVATVTQRLFGQMWLAYALGAGAGLMMIGHAAGLMADHGASARVIAWGPVIISLGNGVGRVAAGWLGDLLAIRWVLTAAGAAGGAVLLAVYVYPDPASVGAALAVMGGGYGIMAAGYPIAVAHYYGADQVGPVYGRLFTAWGVGGALGPAAAGAIHDTAGGYGAAVLAAAAAAAVAAVLTALLPAVRSGQEKV